MCPYVQVVIPSYVLLAFIGGFISLVFLYFRIEKANILFSDFLKAFVISVAGIVVGSKLLFAITQIPWLIRHFSLANLLLLIPQSGYVFYGGLFGLIFSLLIYTHKNKDYRKKLFRLIVPAMPLFHAFGRIGCFMAGCCYGKALKEPFEIGGIAFYHIPVQLIEALLEMVIFVIVLAIDKKKEKVDLLSVYLLLYACVRICMEFMRGDEIRGVFLGISTSQLISILIILYYAVKYFKLKKKSR